MASESADVAVPVARPSLPGPWLWAPLGLVAIIDIASKAWVFQGETPAEAALRWNDSTWVEPHWNPGVAWSLLADSPGLVVALTLVLLPLLVVIYWRSFRGQSRGIDLAFGCILGGALGNAWDRVWSRFPSSGIGGVRDFIHVDLHMVGIPYVWPTFNIADAGITVGFVVLLLSGGLRQPPATRPAANL